MDDSDPMDSGSYEEKRGGDSLKCLFGCIQDDPRDERGDIGLPNGGFAIDELNSSFLEFYVTGMILAFIA